MQIESKSISRILCFDQRFQISNFNLRFQISDFRFFFKSLRSEIANRSGDHSSSPNIAVWIKRPTRKLRAGSSFLESQI